MSKKILILEGSPRKNGNTDLMAQEFAVGATEAGHKVEKIYIKDKTIKGCLGCGACQRNGGSCVQKDDMTEIYEKIVCRCSCIRIPCVFLFMDISDKNGY